MFRCIDNMIPLNCSASCPATQKNKAKRAGGEMMEPRVPHPAACAPLRFCLLSNCTGSLTAPRGRPLCITLRWMTKCRATKVSVLVFTPWGWLRRWTPAVTVHQAVCFQTFLSLSRSSGSAPVCCKIFASVNDSSCTVRCSVSDSLVSVRQKEVST